MKSTKRNDLILLCSVILISAIALGVMYFLFWGRGDTVVVSVDGEETMRLPLAEDTEVVIDGYGGGYNILVIKDGQAYIGEANCPDLVCVHTGKADELKSVVCAPNRVVISVEKE